MDMPDQNWAKNLFERTSQGLIVLHVILSLYYALFSLPLMLIVNLACILSGAIGLRLLKNGQLRPHMLTLYISELIHQIVSVVCVGWSAGFQLPLIGLTTLVFLGEYLGRSMKLPYISALPLGLVNFGTYILAFLPYFHRPGLLNLPYSTALPVESVWSTAVFVFLIWGLYSVVQLTSVSEHHLTNKAETDELTGLLNRAGYDRLLSELDLKSTILFLVDTDKFKGINDNYGHETGDQVLKKISKSLLANFRQNDYVCRIGGDEFAVLMLNTEPLTDEKILEKIRFINRELAGSIDNELPAVSVSVGVANGAGASNWTELFKCADTALYQVKKEGGRGCRVYTELDRS